MEQPKLSEQQKKALELMKSINMDLDPNMLNERRWFVQSELPYITAHSMDALVRKGLLTQMESKTTGYMYYRILDKT